MRSFVIFCILLSPTFVGSFVAHAICELRLSSKLKEVENDFG